MRTATGPKPPPSHRPRYSISIASPKLKNR